MDWINEGVCLVCNRMLRQTTEIGVVVRTRTGHIPWNRDSVLERQVGRNVEGKKTEHQACNKSQRGKEFEHRSLWEGATSRGTSFSVLVAIKYGGRSVLDRRLCPDEHRT